MHPNLQPFDTLLDALREMSSVYLFPVLIVMALLVVLTALVMDRVHRRDGRQHEDDLGALAIPAPQPAVAPQPAGPASAAATPAVLVVDDSAVARAKLRRLFEGAGYTVVAARDGLEALEKLSSDFFSVLVTDLEMPQMSGIELIASVHGSLETEDLPIVAITGHDELQSHARDYQGLYGIFKKPWNDRELLRRVETLATLRRPSAAQAGRSAAGHREAETTARAVTASALH